MSSCLIFQRPDICSTTSLESIRTSTVQSGSRVGRHAQPGDEPAVLGDVVAGDPDELGPLGERPRRSRRRAPGRRSRPARGCRASRRPPRRRSAGSQPRLGRAHQDAAALLAAHHLVRRGGPDALDLLRVELEAAALAAAAARSIGRARHRRWTRGSSRRAPAAAGRCRPRCRPAPSGPCGLVVEVGASAASRFARRRPDATCSASCSARRRSICPVASSRRSMTSSSASSSSACRRASVAISCCSASSSFVRCHHRSPGAPGRGWPAAHLLDVLLGLGLLALQVAGLGLRARRVVAQRRRPRLAARRSRRARAACGGGARAGRGGCRAPGRRAAGTGRWGRVQWGLLELGTWDVHGSVRAVLTRVSTVLARSASSDSNRLLAAGAATATRSPSARRRRGTAGRRALLPGLAGRVVAQVGGQVDVGAAARGRRRAGVAGAAADRDPCDLRVRVAGDPDALRGGGQHRRDALGERRQGHRLRRARPTRPRPRAGPRSRELEHVERRLLVRVGLRAAPARRPRAVRAAGPSRRGSRATCCDLADRADGRVRAGLRRERAGARRRPGAAARSRRSRPAPAAASASTAARRRRRGTNTTSLSSGWPARRQRVEVGRARASRASASLTPGDGDVGVGVRDVEPAARP